MNWKRFYLSLSFLLAFLGSGELMAQCGNFRVYAYPDSSTCPAQFVQAYTSGGQAPYTYQWSTGATTNFIATPSLGTYSVTVQDANGCTTTDTIVVNTFSLTASVFDASCGNNNGQIQLSVSGSGPYDLRWYNANWQYVGSGMTLANVPAGSYTVQAYDSTTQCYESQTYTVGGGNGPQATIFPDTASCPVNTLFAGASAGTAPYTYHWSNGATTSSIANLAAAQNYSLVVIDANGCADTTNYYIDTLCNQQPPCNISILMLDDSIGCPANWVHAMPSGGTAPYSYAWSNGQTTASISNLVAGFNYMVTVTDAAGCTASTNYYVDTTNCNQQQPCNISIFISEDSIGCPANWVHAMPSGGTSPYSYAWSNGQTTASISNLVAGFNYMVTVTDAAGCTASTNYYVDTTNCNQQPVCNMQAYTYSQGCPADTLSAYVWNGAAPYTYSWSTGLTVTTQNNIHDAYAVNGAGLYSLTVTDANGCTAVSSVQVNSQAPMQVGYTINDASCGQNDGAIDLTVSGGDGMYMYSWSNNVSNGWQEDQSNLAPGFYSVYVYDSSGCSVYLDSLIVNGSGTINPSMTPANCVDSLGAIALNPTGFSNPQFVWNTGDTGPNLNNLASGVYTVTITDDSCQTARTFFLDQDSSCAIMIAGRVTDNTAGATCAQGTAEAFRLVRLQPAGIITTTNQYGYYQFTVTQTGNYTVELLPDGVSSQLCPAANINVNAANVGGYYGGNDFVVTHPPVNDLRVNLVHYSTSTPGFDLYTYVYYCNDGNTTQNATITVDYDSQLEFNSTAMNPNYANATYYSYSNAMMTSHDAVNNNITFTANNLGAGECGLIRIYLSTPTTVALGNQVANSVAITPISGDATPANNTDVDSLIVVGSWDPNEIVLRPTRSGDPRGQAEIFEQDDVLDYTIHFQNLGTAPAYTVVVRDTLDASFDMSSLRNLQFSHPATMTVENGNILVFTFNNINLPDADSDEPGSHGFINYSIDRDPNLPLGSVIPNKAAIYFDFNAPVITNLSEAIISSPTSTRQVELLNTSFKVFPNPSQGQYFVSFEQNQTQDLHLQVYNMQGQLLLEKTQADAPTSGQMSFDLSNFPAAHYLLRINGQDQLIQKQ
ncbi:DUF7619 domain-containing protein [Saprospira grandis]|uniref:DUF7619 domain-containing protein n=1 Tax=Saprospira grandis TaxID=1008 RepID=UPI0022DE4D1E|nr:T9SS type A sorting domain-containing protein [Saprospira grandis]WBM75877.1 T9SS type A sorting domain-containing protein [Saprospira grandis]